MRHGLGAVEQHGHAAPVRLGDEVLHRHDRAERVRYVGQREQPRAIRQQRLEGGEVHFARPGHRDHAQLRAGLLAHHLPGHDVGVVLEPRDEDFVAALQARSRVALRDEVDRLGRAAHEDHLARRAGVHEATQLLAGAFEQVGRLLAQRVHAAMHVGVGRLVVVGHGVDHALRALARGGVVEVAERLAVHAHREHRELTPDRRDVEWRGSLRGRHVGRAHAGVSSRRVSRSSRTACTAAA